MTYQELMHTKLVVKVVLMLTRVVLSTVYHCTVTEITEPPAVSIYQSYYYLDTLRADSLSISLDTSTADTRLSWGLFNIWNNVRLKFNIILQT